MQDIYTRITNQIISQVEAGTVPWVKPWSQEADPLPRNAISQRHYRGINILLLAAASFEQGFADNRWLTFRQASALGAHVRKGERGTPIVFFRMRETDDPAPGKERAPRVIPMLRTFTVFNLEQIEGIDREPFPEPTWAPEKLAENLITGSGAVIEHGGNLACYLPNRDVIKMPQPSSFSNASGYYATALHELAHWTGHPSRCDRPLGRRFGLEAYAFEELVAEITSAFLCAHCRLDGQLQHASYIDSWLAALRGDKRLIFTAASQAQKAADFITGYDAPQTEATVQEVA